MQNRTPSTPKKGAGFDRDMKTFEAQPANAKELARLKDRAEKSTGP